jgi:hypothetical protein
MAKQSYIHFYYSAVIGVPADAVVMISAPGVSLWLATAISLVAEPKVKLDMIARPTLLYLRIRTAVFLSELLCRIWPRGVSFACPSAITQIALAGLAVLFITNVAYVPVARAQQPQPCHVTDLRDSLFRLRNDLNAKIDFDIRSIGHTFNIARVAEPTLWQTLPNLLLQAANTIMRSLSALKSATHIHAMSTLTTLELHAWLNSLHAFRDASDEYILSRVGPPYAHRIRLMYDDAQRATTHEQYVQTIIHHLSGRSGQRIVPVSPPPSQELHSLIYEIDAVKTAFAATVDRFLMSEVATAIATQPSTSFAICAAIEEVEAIARAIRRSRATGMEVTDHTRRRVVRLGAIAQLSQAELPLVNALNQGLGRQAVQVSVTAASLVGDAVMLKTGLIGPNLSMTVESSQLLAEILLPLGETTRTVTVRQQLLELPQQMVFSLGNEISTAWRVAAGAITAVRQELGLPREHVACSNRFTRSQAVQAGFGAAHNVLSAEGELLVRAASCRAGQVEWLMGSGSRNQYVYKDGYAWNGHSWEEFRLSGPEASGEWFVGQAWARRVLSEPQLNNVRFFVAFICHWTGSQWKCGCRDEACRQPFWQLQAFERQR